MLTFDAAAHAYAWSGRPVPSVTSIIRSVLGDPFERVAAPVLEHARQRGSAVHKACELDDEGRLDESTVDRRIVPYVEAWREFRREFPFTVLFAETPLYSMVNGFAGTPDVAAQLDDGSVICIDRKTGLPGIGAALQTAAYSELIADKLSLASPLAVGRFALRMLPTGRYRFDEYSNPRDWREFLACLTVYRLRERAAA